MWDNHKPINLQGLQGMRHPWVSLPKGIYIHTYTQPYVYIKHIHMYTRTYIYVCVFVQPRIHTHPQHLHIYSAVHSGLKQAFNPRTRVNPSEKTWKRVECQVLNTYCSDLEISRYGFALFASVDTAHVCWPYPGWESLGANLCFRWAHLGGLA